MPSGNKISLKYHEYTNVGGRDNNEDALACAVSDGRGVFVLCDGLGGHAHGETASRFAAENLKKMLEAVKTLEPEVLLKTFEFVNDALLKSKAKHPEYKSMKTTASALCVDLGEGSAVWAHAGDTRIYFLSDGKIKSQTNDHSVSYKKYLNGEIRYGDINSDEDRSGLLSVMGNPDRFDPEASPEPAALKKGDAFLICTDGFWEYLMRDEILIDRLKSRTPEEWADFMLLRHITRTKKSHDNYSLITVFVE